jgi:hypothetical protein
MVFRYSGDEVGRKLEDGQAAMTLAGKIGKLR